MKLTKLKLFILSTLCIFVLSNCSENNGINSNLAEAKDYSSTISQQRIVFAKNLMVSINENEEIAKVITSECIKRFDGDNEVLCKNLFDIATSQSNASINIGEFVNNVSKTKRTKSNLDVNNFSSLLLSKDSLLQIYFYNITGDSSSFEGIVVVPENVKERDGKDLLVINKDGSESYIKSDVDPLKNYLVISQNERTSSSELKSAYVSSNRQNSATATATEGKNISITRAKFISMDAKRTVEDWWGGEPEVRVNMIYALIDPVTNKPIEARNTSFIYPGSWLNLGVFTNTVKWNNTVMNFPFWNLNEQNYGRRIMWIEEDGTSAETTTSTGFTDKNTGLTTTLSSKRPATNNDINFSDSWIDYNNTAAGLITWGIIQFEIAY